LVKITIYFHPSIFGREFRNGKRKNPHVLQNKVKVLTFLRKRISEISIKYTARTLKNCCVVKI